MPAPDSRPNPPRPSLPAAVAQAFSQGRVDAHAPLPAWTGPIFHALRGFLDNHGLLLASALSYTTVLSIVPFLAVAFSIAKGLGLYNAPQVQGLLLRLTAGRAEVAERILEYIQNTNVKTLGALGTALLLATAVSLLSTVEGALNSIWRVESKRGPWTRFTSYTALIVVCPVLLFTVISVTASLKSSASARWLLGFSLTHFAATWLLAVMPLLLVWLIFFLVYKFLPNLRVASLPALVGALVAGSLWQGLQWAYLTFQFGAAQYNAIYGSFAQIPLLLLWLHLSWGIVLLGAQISHTAQRYRQEVAAAATSLTCQADRHGLALLLLLVLAKAAGDRRQPPAAPVLAERLGLPGEAVEDILTRLATAGLVIEAAAPKGRTFVPLASPRDVSAAEVLRVLDGRAEAPFPGSLTARLPVARKLLEAADARETAPTLADLLSRFTTELDGLDAAES